jgi:tetratricopeptide (TPR) repeat protein
MDSDAACPPQGAAMASVFLSYDRDDSDRARHFARALEKAGHQVWWDLHVRGGAQFSKVIEEALKAADAVVVLWSANSIESAWVRDEAGAGRDSGRLVPVTIDGTLAPLGFRQFQTIDLSSWRGRGSPQGLRTLLADIDANSAGETEAAAPTTAQTTKRQTTRAFSPSSLTLLVGVLVGLVAAGGAYWFMARGNAGPATVAVTAADTSPRSQQMARDLLVNLGNLQSAKSGSMTLVDKAANSAAPDLLFQAGQTADGAMLTLLSGADHGLLWSRNFEQPSGNVSDLKQQLAFTAGKVLGCALDGLSQNEVRLKPQVLKIYLNACAQLSEGGDPRPVIPMLRQVTRDAPHFAPAWSRLLLAQATISDLLFTDGVPDETARSDLRQQIAEARKLFPGIPEADLAESVLLPVTAYGQKLDLIDRAARHDPDNADVLSFRSQTLQSVGRMGDAIADAARASQIDPLSPALREGHMAALAYAGYFDSAREQLTEIEKLWPGSSTAESARYTFNFRYGDPKIALEMDETKNSTAGVLYLLQARIDPSPANVKRLVDFLRGRKDRFRGTAGPGRLQYYTLAMAGVHQDDELFDTLTHWFKPDELPLIAATYFRPELHEFRKEPRFFIILKRAGLVDYWQKSGKWPDFCFETDMPYDCKKEAAKLK